MNAPLFCSFLMHLIINHCSTFSLFCQQKSKVLVVVRFGMPDFLNLSSPRYTARKWCLFSSDSGWNCKHQHQQDLWSVLTSSFIKCWYEIDISASANTFAILCITSSKFCGGQDNYPKIYILQTHFHTIFPSLCSCSFSSDLSLTPILILCLQWSSSPCILHVIKFRTNYSVNFCSNRVIRILSSLSCFSLLFQYKDRILEILRT